MFNTFRPEYHNFSRKMRLNGIKQTRHTMGEAFLNSNHPSLKGIKQIMNFLGPIKWSFWDPRDVKFGPDV